MFDVLVIGGGMIGSAALRHLSGGGAKVGLIGPEEPDDFARHEGVFASHYDHGRITRTLDKDEVWGRLAQRSIAQYGRLEAASGLRFHGPCGFLHVGPPSTSEDDKLARVEAVGRWLGTQFEQLDDDALKHRFPYLTFPPGYLGLYEQDGAGTINPRSLVRAQQAIAYNQHAALIRDTVLSTRKARHLFEVRTSAGETYHASKLLIATGAFTNHFDLIDHELDLDVKAETVWLARISPAETERLRGMPSIWYDLDWHPTFPYAYVLPPIQYPDGHYYAKIGVDRDPSAEKVSLEEIKEFFHSGGHAQRGNELRDLIQTIMPQVQLDAGLPKPCILAYTPHGRPMVDATSEAGVFVAVGGCGGAAKSSDEIGRMAALLVQHGAWRHDLDASLFRACFR